MSNYRFYVIEHTDGSFHAPSSWEETTPIESHFIYNAIQFHEEERHVAQEILATLQSEYPQIEAYQESKVQLYECFLLNEGEEYTKPEKTEIVETYYVCTEEPWTLTTSSLYHRPRKYLKDGAGYTFHFEEALHLTYDEAKKIREKEGMSCWNVAQYVLMKLPSEKEKEEKGPSFKEHIEYILQFQDGFYLAGNSSGNLKLETRYVEEATRIQAHDLKKVLKKISEAETEHPLRKNPKVGEIHYVPSIELHKNHLKEGFVEEQRYYQVCSNGKLVPKEYHENHYKAPCENRNKVIDQGTPYYNARLYGNEVTKKLPKHGYTYEEALETVSYLNQNYDQQLQRHVVEITVLTKII